MFAEFWVDILYTIFLHTSRFYMSYHSMSYLVLYWICSQNWCYKCIYCQISDYLRWGKRKSFKQHFPLNHQIISSYLSQHCWIADSSTKTASVAPADLLWHSVGYCAVKGMVVKLWKCKTKSFKRFLEVMIWWFKVKCGMNTLQSLTVFLVLHLTGE